MVYDSILYFKNFNFLKIYFYYLKFDIFNLHLNGKFLPGVYLMLAQINSRFFYFSQFPWLDDANGSADT